jgi:hypothetical protein
MYLSKDERFGSWFDTLTTSGCRRSIRRLRRVMF